MPDATSEQMESFVKMQTETVSPENAARLRQIVDRFDVADILSSISIPNLVVHANDDAVQPRPQGRILASEISDAKYCSLDSRNHAPLPQEANWKRIIDES